MKMTIDNGFERATVTPPAPEPKATLEPYPAAYQRTIYTRAQFELAVRKAKNIFANVKISERENDCLPISKKALLKQFAYYKPTMGNRWEGVRCSWCEARETLFIG